MPRGASDIPVLRLEVLQKFVTSFMSPPELVLSNLFSSSVSPSSTVKWESQRGGRGMTPFVPPGAPAHLTAPHGVASHVAEAAFWKEKMYLDEEFLNNLRKEGTESQYLAATQRLARELSFMTNRANRRKEWMFSQMLTKGSFEYNEASGLKLDVDYDIDTNHVVSLGSSYYWDSGASRDILGDIRDGKKLVAEDCGGKVNLAMCNSSVLKMMADDSTFQAYFESRKFQAGLGNPFAGSKAGKWLGVNPKVIGALLDIDNLLIYDEMYEVKAFLTAAVTAASTTWVTVDSIADFKTGEKVRFHDVSAGSYEDKYITSVDVENQRFQINGTTSASFKAAEDYVTMTAYFLPSDKFVMMSTNVDGQPIAEFKKAPHGNNRHYGLRTDQWDVKDPEGVYIRVQDKGLPVLYQRDAVYILDVTATTAQAATSTTTTSSSSSSTTSTAA